MTYIDPRRRRVYWITLLSIFFVAAVRGYDDLDNSPPDERLEHLLLLADQMDVAWSVKGDWDNPGGGVHER